MRINFRGGWKDILLIFLTFLLFLGLLILPAAYAAAEKVNEPLIRFHVVAHSNSYRDQQIKLQVRNAVWKAFGPMLIRSSQKGFEALNSAISDNLDGIEKLAQEKAYALGFTGKVKAEAGVIHLPDKRYQGGILPEGEYHGLRITLGDGAGENWWCVLYPDLCLSLSQTAAAQPVLFFRWSARDIFKHWLLFGK